MYICCKVWYNRPKAERREDAGMTINDLIHQLQQFAAQDLKGGDATVKLFDRRTDSEFVVNPDDDVFEFEVLRGDGEVVIEFTS
jgi:hypothetical protein